MNLRTKFLWNVFTFLSFLTIVYTGYHLYLIYNEKVKLRQTYDTEKMGTDKDLSDKVKLLEDKLMTQVNYKFKVKSIPTDITKVIAMDGVDFSNYGVSSLRFSAGIFGSKQHAIAQYKNNTIKVIVGDSIAGGTVEKITPTEVIFLKDGERFRHVLTPKLN